MAKRAIRAKRGRTAALGSAIALLAAGISGGLWAGANAVAPTLQPDIYILVGAADGLCLSAPDRRRPGRRTAGAAAVWEGASALVAGRRG